MSKHASRRLAATLSSASQVSVKFGQSDLGAIELDDAAAAYRELRKCARQD